MDSFKRQCGFNLAIGSFQKAFLRGISGKWCEKNGAEKNWRENVWRERVESQFKHSSRNILVEEK